MRDKEGQKRELAEAGGKVRLFVQAPLASDEAVSLSEAQAHYLIHVMRARVGDRVRLFNGRDGEWAARLSQTGKKSCTLVCETRTLTQGASPDLWLAFAPIKKTPADYVAQKATELGARVLQPVITQHTIVRRVNADRLRANAIEAAEQSGRTDVPEVRLPVDLPALLAHWPKDRRLVFCDESGEATPIADALAEEKAQSWGILTGPEGGFEIRERVAIRACGFALPVSLGPRIMRADTAALAALSIWQALKGDWRA